MIYNKKKKLVFTTKLNIYILKYDLIISINSSLFYGKLY